MTQVLRKYLITGILVSLPLVITIYVLWFVLSFLDGVFGNLVEIAFGRAIPGAGTVLTVGLLLLVGMFAASPGRRLIHFGERILLSIPVVRPIYHSVKQVIDAFSTQPRSFRQAVLVEYPRRGLFALAFVTNETMGGLRDQDGNPLIAVFIPTTPNPTSGFILMVPKDDVLPVNLTVEQAFKIIISGGLVLPETIEAEGVEAENSAAGEGGERHVGSPRVDPAKAGDAADGGGEAEAVAVKNS